MAETKTITRKTIFHLVEIDSSMKDTCVRLVDEALDKYTIEKDVATSVKKAFDEKYGGTWHCVVGRNFGCSVTHETKYLLFFQMEETYILMFCSDNPTNKPSAETETK